MAITKYQDFALSRTGGVVPHATVLVQSYPSAATATIYTDNTGGTTTANPIICDEFGFFSFYAQPGHYNLVITGSGISPRTITDITVLDASMAVIVPPTVGSWWVSPDTATFGFTRAAIQDAINTSQANGYLPVIISPGHYIWEDSSNANPRRLDIDVQLDTSPVSSDSAKCAAARMTSLIGVGHVVFDSSAFTTVQAAILVAGGEGAACNGVIQNINFVGSPLGAFGAHNPTTISNPETSNSVHIVVRGTQFRVKNCNFYSGRIACQVRGQGTFSENFIMEDCVIRVFCTTALHYNYYDTVSFNGTGMINCLIEMQNTAPAIIIDQHAFVYNAPLQIKVQANAAADGPLKACVIIQNFNGSELVQPTFQGHITFEAAPFNVTKIVACVNSAEQPGVASRAVFVGRINGIGGGRGGSSGGGPSGDTNMAGFQLGDMYIVDAATTQNHIAQPCVIGQQHHFQFPLLPGANSVVAAQGCTEMHLRILAQGYDQHWIVDISSNIGSSNNVVDAGLRATLVNNYDTVGWGTSEITMQDGENIIITNNNFPIATNVPTCQVDAYSYAPFSTVRANTANAPSNGIDISRFQYNYEQWFTFLAADVNFGIANSIHIPQVAPGSVSTANLWTGKLIYIGAPAALDGVSVPGMIFGDQLAFTSANVDVANSCLTIPNTVISNNNKVLYRAATTAIPGLVDDIFYYGVVENTTVGDPPVPNPKNPTGVKILRLCHTAEDALREIARPSTDPPVYILFAGTGVGAMTLTRELSNQNWYAIIPDLVTIQLAGSPGLALAGLATNITGSRAGTGTWTFGMRG